MPANATLTDSWRDLVQCVVKFEKEEVEILVEILLSPYFFGIVFANTKRKCRWLTHF